MRLRWLRRLALVGGWLLAVAGGAPPVLSQAVPLGYVAVPLLEFRAGPGANYPPATLADIGQDVALVGRNFDGTWLNVTVPGSGSGWARRSTLWVPGSIAGLPATDGSARQPQAYPLAAIRVSADPAPAAAEVGRAPRWAALSLLGQSADGQWARVRQADGLEGWVAVRYLRTSAVLGTLPVTGGQVATPTPTPPPALTSVPTPFLPNLLFWFGEYFPNRELSGTVALTRADAVIDFQWGGGVPAAGVPADSFSVRWTRLVPLDAGPYRFHLAVDDGARLWVDDQLLIDDWRTGPARELTADLNVTAGPRVLRLEYFDQAGDASVRLRWEKLTTFRDWRGEYWDNPALSGAPLVVRNDPAVDFYWGPAAPAEGLPVDGFSARWARELTLEAGTYRFTVLMDDGARLWVDDRLVVDDWRVDAEREVAVEVSLSTGLHRLRLEYFDAFGAARVRLNWTWFGPQTFPDWKAEYWANPTLDGLPAVIRNDPQIDFDWGANAPALGVPADRFSARWTRTVAFEAGVYTFSAVADDGIRVFVDGQAVINQWRDQDSGVWTAEVTLAAGAHTIVVEYYDNQALARARVNWTRR